MRCENMNYTVKEVSKRLNVHISCIYRKIEKFSMDSGFLTYSHNANGRKTAYITEEGFRYLSSIYNSERQFSTQNDKNKKKNAEFCQNSHKGENDIQNEYINFLLAQLKEKDTQIANLLELNRNNQVLIQELNSTNIKLLEKEKLLLESGKTSKKRPFSFLFKG